MKQRVIFNHGGRTYSGPVTSAANYSFDETAPNWYVEFVNDAQSAGRTGDPGYVKQLPDGVTNLRFEEIAE